MHEHYRRNKDIIKTRIEQFSSFRYRSVEWEYDGKLRLVPSKYPGDERLFHEIVFCILAANTSAVMAAKAVQDTRKILMSASSESLQKALKESGCRFHTLRADYIVWTRQRLKDIYDLQIISLLDKHEPAHLREILVDNIKGFGYKEASHFLRNVGVFGLAILDKHILRGLKEQGVINKLPRSLTWKRYLAYEKRYLDFAEKIDIAPEELDLVMWSQKNGRVLK